MTTERVVADGTGRGPQVGDVAPGFELRQTFDRVVSLEEMVERSTVLLCFYVFDFGHV